MLKYLKNSDIAVRLNLNPFNWKWLPALSYDPPTQFYPKRRTFAVVWLGIQIFLDMDNGETDLQSLQQLFVNTLDVVEEDEKSKVGHPLSKASERSSVLE